MTQETRKLNAAQMVAQVAAELAKVGVGKEGYNDKKNYHYRQIEALLNVISPIMAKVGLICVPRYLSRETTQLTSSKGHLYFHTFLEAEFHFISSHDGSEIVVRTYGEGLDTGDKSTNMAMTAAFKYALIQLNMIPFVGHDDGDAYSPMVEVDQPTATKQRPKAKAEEPPAALPEYPAEKIDENLPKWQEMVKGGKSVEAIIATIRTKYDLPEALADVIRVNCKQG